MPTQTKSHSDQEQGNKSRAPIENNDAVCNASQELSVFIPVRQPINTVTGDEIFRNLPTFAVSGR